MLDTQAVMDAAKRDGIEFDVTKAQRRVIVRDMEVGSFFEVQQVVWLNNIPQWYTMFYLDPFTCENRIARFRTQPEAVAFCNRPDMFDIKAPAGEPPTVVYKFTGWSVLDK